MNKLDAERAGFTGRAYFNGRAINLDRAGIASDGAAENLHQRRFPGAVLANQRDDLTGGDSQADAIERNNPWEPFTDSLHFEDWNISGHETFRIEVLTTCPGAD